MTKREAVRKFQEDFAYLYMSEVDYWKAEEWWSYFVDDLNRNGIITNRQRENWAAPFPYGKHLKLTRWMVKQGYPTLARLKELGYCEEYN